MGVDEVEQRFGGAKQVHDVLRTAIAEPGCGFRCDRRASSCDGMVEAVTQMVSHLCWFNRVERDGEDYRWSCKD